MPVPSRIDVDAALRTVTDPDFGVNLVDLGVVYGVEVMTDRIVVDLALTVPDSPHGPRMESAVKAVLAPCAQGATVVVRWVSAPPWHPGRMTDAGRAYLNGYEE